MADKLVTEQSMQFYILLTSMHLKYHYRVAQSWSLCYRRALPVEAAKCQQSDVYFSVPANG